MNLSFFIARRYFRSKKSHHIINIIAGVSVAGVTIGTLALVVVLSVFNGFENLVVSLFNSFNPDLRITLREGKSFHRADLSQEILKEIPGVWCLTEVLEENALMRYKDRQSIVTLKGVSPGFTGTTGIDTMMTEGRFLLEDGDHDFTVLGNGVAYFLNANLNDYLNPIQVFVPSRNEPPGVMADQVFSQGSVFPAGYFCIQQDFDVKYAIVPIRFVRRLLDHPAAALSEDRLPAEALFQWKCMHRVESAAGSRFRVQNRYQQQEFLYQIMRTEKWIIFAILTFILLLATFNVVGSLSMLILEKKKDIAVLQCLGAGKPLIRRIFLTEGLLISVTGALAGMILGAAVCWIQQTWGVIRMGGPGSTFVVNTYPVHMQPLDFVLVFLTVLTIGYAAAWYPVHNIRKINTSDQNLL